MKTGVAWINDGWRWVLAWVTGPESPRAAPRFQRLAAGDAVSIQRSGTGVVRLGKIWLTDGGFSGDLILDRGSLIHVLRPGCTVIQALEPAEIQWFTPTRKRHEG